MRRRGAGNEAPESGWISMCDVLLLLFTVGLLVAGSAVLHNQQSEETIVDLEEGVKERDAEIEKLKTAIGGVTIGPKPKNNARDPREHGEFTIAFGEGAEGYKRLVKLREAICKPGETLPDAWKRVTGELAGAVAAADKAAEDAKKAIGDRIAIEKLLSDAKEEAGRAKVAAEDAARRAKIAEGKNEGLTIAFDEQEVKSKILDAESKRIAELLSKSGIQIDDLKGEITVLKGILDGIGDVKKELLGIPGAIGNVALVIDRSASMEKGGRWEDAKRVINDWVSHLPVKKAVLIAFGSDVLTIPQALENGKEQSFDTRELPEMDELARTEMAAQLSTMSPWGATQTLRGLRRAMQFKALDAIVLFTDGAPDSVSSSGSNSDPREEIFALVTQWKIDHPNARIHTVGIGDYFSASMRDFLLGIARRTDGAFLGR